MVSLVLLGVYRPSDTLSRVFEYFGGLVPGESDVVSAAGVSRAITNNTFPGFIPDAVSAAGMDGWVIPEVCKANPALLRPPIFKNGTTARVLLLLYGGSFRGYQGLKHNVGFHYPKSKFQCTPDAVLIQKAIIMSILTNVIEPLEARGVEVDIATNTQDCDKFVVGLTHSSEATAAKENKRLKQALGNLSFKQALKFWLGAKPTTSSQTARVVKQSFYDFEETTAMEDFGWQAQADGFLFGMTMVEQLLLAGYQYRSVLCWRFDMAATEYWGGPGIGIANIAAYLGNRGSDNLEEIVSAKKYNLAEYFVLVSGEYQLQRVDQIFSFPGWIMPCVISLCVYGNNTARYCMPRHLLHDTDDLHMRNRSWDSPPSENPPLRQSRKYFFAELIYRGPYGILPHDGGKLVCRYLHKNFDGPGCGAVRMGQEVCRTLHERVNASQSFLAVEMEDFWLLVQKENSLREAYIKTDSWRLDRMKKHQVDIPFPDEFIVFNETGVITGCCDILC